MKGGNTFELLRDCCIHDVVERQAVTERDGSLAVELHHVYMEPKTLWDNE